MSAIDPVTKSQIEETIKQNRVVVFMKGNKLFPQCGFSAAVVSILKEMGVEFETHNVLADPALRDGIKAFSDWPTIPQLYVNGEFVGGCDIVREMAETGELAELLGVAVEPTPEPTITLTDAAMKAIAEAEEPGEDTLRIEIDAQFHTELFFGPPEPSDVATTTGDRPIRMSAATARRANGLAIDYVDGPDGAGFRIDNPNAPPSVKPLRPEDLKRMLEAGEAPNLFDVRTPEERDKANIRGSVLLDEEGERALAALPKDAPIVVFCHHGVRSLSAAEQLIRTGHRRVYNLVGGIDAWSRSVDPQIPRY